jgi:hypothetical protein
VTGPQNPAAFPVHGQRWDRVYGDCEVNFPGMSLRDYFAAAELQKVQGTAICDVPESYARVADHCYRMADAMLTERSKP